MKTFSIIIPVYNLLKTENKIYFSFLIDSISRNLENSFVKKRFKELIIINDLPEEQIESYIKNVFEPLDIQYHLLSNKTNKGQAFSRNYGAKLSNSDYLHFIDQDDFISSNFYYNILDNIESENKEIIISSPYTYRNESEYYYPQMRKMTLNIFENQSYIKNIWYMQLSNIITSPGQFLISKTIFEKVQGFPDLKHKGSDDYGFILKLIFMHDTSMKFIRNSIFYYRIHNYQGSKTLNMKESIKELFMTFNAPINKKSTFKLLYLFRTKKIFYFPYLLFFFLFFRRK